MKWVVVSLIDRKSARLTVLLSATSIATRCCIFLPSQSAVVVVTVCLVSRAKCINRDTMELKKKYIYYTRRYLKPQPSGHYMYHQFTIQQLEVLPTQCIYVFCVDLRTNSDYFPIQQ